MRITRHFTVENASPFIGAEWGQSTAGAQTSSPQSTAFETEVGRHIRQITVPARVRPVEDRHIPAWLRRCEPDEEALAALPPHERTRREASLQNACRRLAGAWTYWGWLGGYFDREQDARAFQDELCFLFASQTLTPDTRFWRHVGLHWAYGIQSTTPYFYIDSTTGEIRQAEAATPHLGHAAIFATSGPAQRRDYEPSAEIDLSPFLQQGLLFDHTGLDYAIRIAVIALDISITMAQYPDAASASAASSHRGIRLAPRNLGRLLASNGIHPAPTHSNTPNGAILALMAARALATSAEIAAELGPFPAFPDNRDAMLANLAKQEQAIIGAVSSHSAAARNGRPDHLPPTNQAVTALVERAWAEALRLGAQQGFRNARVSRVAAEHIAPWPQASDRQAQADKTGATAEEPPAGSTAPTRTPLPRRRRGWTEELEVGSHILNLRTEEYLDGRLGSFSISLENGDPASRQLLDCFSAAVSIGLQHGVPLATYRNSLPMRHTEPGQSMKEEAVPTIAAILESAFNHLERAYPPSRPSRTAEMQFPRSTYFVVSGVADSPCTDCADHGTIGRNDGFECTECTQKDQNSAIGLDITHLNPAQSIQSV